MKWMGWSYFDLLIAPPIIVEAIINLINEEQSTFNKK